MTEAAASPLVAGAIDLALVLVGLALAFGALRLLRGPSLADRVVALDLIGAVAVGGVAVFAMRERQPAYLLVSGESYLATHATGVFRISFLGIGPTELRILLAIGLLKAAQAGEIAVAGLGAFRLFDAGGIAAAAALGAVFVASATRNTRALYRAEPLPGASPRGIA